MMAALIELESVIESKFQSPNPPWQIVSKRRTSHKNLGSQSSNDSDILVA